MPNGYSPDNRALSAAVVVPASSTNFVVTKQWPVSANGSIHHVVKIVAASVTSSTGITAKLQTAIGTDWVDTKTVAITINGPVYIKLNVEVSGDQTFLPLLSQARLVVSSGSGDAVTITEVDSLQDQ